MLSKRKNSSLGSLACEMTVELFGFDKADFIDGVEFAGAASYFDEAATGDHHLYM